MNEIRVYLFRVISGAVLSAVFLSLPLRKALRSILSLACGCLMMILTLSPFVRLDWQSVAARIPLLFEESLPQVDTKSNEELLQELICEQTEAQIVQKAAALGIRAEADVSVQYDKAVGSYLPYSVKIKVTESKGGLDGLRSYLTSELAIPEERQTWTLK